MRQNSDFSAAAIFSAQRLSNQDMLDAELERAWRPTSVTGMVPHRIRCSFTSRCRSRGQMANKPSGFDLSRMMSTCNDAKQPFQNPRSAASPEHQRHAVRCPAGADVDGAQGRLDRLLFGTSEPVQQPLRLRHNEPTRLLLTSCLASVPVKARDFQRRSGWHRCKDKYP